MPKGFVQATARKSAQVVKPEPPNDLWAKLDATLRKSGKAGRTVERPPGSFTVMEYASQEKLRYSTAYKRILDMELLGKVRCVKAKNVNYYFVVDEKEDKNRSGKDASRLDKRSRNNHHSAGRSRSSSVAD